MARYRLENGARYQAAIKATRFEKCLMSPVQLMQTLQEAGLRNCTYKSVAGGVIVAGTYAGPSGLANLPDRVVRVQRLSMPPRG